MGTFKKGDKGESKVKSVTANGTWNDLFKFEYVLENGLVIGAMHKSQDGFKAGDEVSYEVVRENEQYGLSGKISKPQEQNSNKGANYNKDPKTQLMILAQSTLAKSVDIYNHGGLDEIIKSFSAEGKSKEDAIVSALHSISGKLMRSQLALVEDLSK
jgi:hypothetical protein